MRFINRYVVFTFLILAVRLAGAQVVATLELTPGKPANGLDIPVSINLDQITFTADSSLSLYLISGAKKSPVPYQISTSENRNMHWLLHPDKANTEKYVYQLIKTPASKADEIVAEKNDGELTFRSDNKNLLRYYFKTVYPPQGIDTSYKRSGFIHPLWTPHGQELTRIQPRDHYHHYGIWNPWTHVLFEGDTVDFWNIRGRQGTVRFAKFISVTNGDVYSEFEALHEHVRFYKDGSEKVALNELQTVRVYKPETNSDYFLVDITSKLSCATGEPFHILAYRYAGLGWRATEFWDKNNMEVLTSEGKTRQNADNTNARWILSQGALPGNEYGGIVMLSHPANYNYPEPLRIWDQTQNRGRGDYFANFAPTKDMDWILEPGKTYVLRYRLVVFSGKFDAAKSESAWQYFARPPHINIK